MNFSPSRFNVLLLLLALPLGLSWGLGMLHPILDRLGVVGASLFGLAGALEGSVGLLLALTTVALGLAQRAGRVRVLHILNPLVVAGSLSFMLSALALWGPLLLLLLVPGLWCWVGRRDAVDRSSLSALPEIPWGLPEAGLPFVGGLAWLLAAQSRPWTSGRGDWLEGLLLPFVSDWSLSVRVLFALLPFAACLLFLLRHGPLRGWPLALGFLAGAALELVLGTPLSWPFAGLVGALAWARPPRIVAFLWQPASWLLPVAGLSLSAGVAQGLTERWICPAPQAEHLRFLSQEVVPKEIGLVPGNLPYILVLTEDGGTLQRLGPTGVPNEEIELDLPGGELVTSGRSGGSVARIVPGEVARVEWWNPASMERIATMELGAECRSAGGVMEAGSDVLILQCESRQLLRLDPDSGKAQPVGSLAEGIAGPLEDGSSLPLRWVSGPGARMVAERSLTGAAEAMGPVGLGPYSGAVRSSEGGIFVARGPLSRVEVRGSLGNIRDSARVPGWPADIAWSERKKALWVTSATSGQVSLVDNEVTWHRRSFSLGPRVKEMVPDPDSGRLFGLNRCGLFELRIDSIFPWESTGDVEGPGAGGAKRKKGATSQ